MALIDYDLFRGEIDKVQMAIDRLKEFEPPEGYYLAFSGGKDSVVIKRLAEMSGVKFDAHYSLTTVDPPELVQFIKKYHPDTAWNIPEKPLMQKMLDKKFPPLRQQRWCCEIYKEQGGEGRLIITGIRWAESMRRSKRRMIESCYKDEKKQYFNLIIDWENQDVWDFIKQEKIPYCNLYDEGFKRLGCILCPMATTKHRHKEMERWPKIAEAWRRWCNRLYDEQVGKINKYGRPRFGNFKTGDELFEWWIANKAAQNPDQTVLFE